MSKSQTSCRSIFAAVTALSFSAQQEKDCVDFITRRHDNTEIAPISDEAQLALKADGRLVDSDYRFNLISFLAVCQVISGGLSRVFGEVSGEMPSKLFDADSCSIPAAVGIYNTALRVRFDTLRERSILLDHTSRTVDGFLGLNHKMLDNVAFYSLLKDRLASRSFADGFQRAELVGRELRIYVVDTATKTNDLHTNPAHTFASGWYFCNREDSGNAIRAIPCLFTKFGIAALPEQRDYRLVHVGSDLVGKASAMFTKSLNYTFDMDQLRKRIPAMCEYKLGFTEARAQRNAVTQKWVTILIQRGVHKNAALAILKNTMEVGADLEPRNLLDVFTDKVLMGRNVYDLFCSICRYARNQPTAIRERLQATSAEFLLSIAKLPRST